MLVKKIRSVSMRTIGVVFLLGGLVGAIAVGQDTEPSTTYTYQEVEGVKRVRRRHESHIMERKALVDLIAEKQSLRGRCVEIRNRMQSKAEGYTTEIENLKRQLEKWSEEE